ncbi:MAG: type II secretion system protein [Phycisphaerales bacterium]|nr:type II secretion system protein [Phycisphaerales bacterium]
MSMNYRNAFTLIEMLIVIGIIALLAGLTLGISNKVLRGSEIRKTKDAITLLDTAISEWQSEMGRPITFESAGAPAGNYDIASDEILQAPSFVSAVSQEDMEVAMSERATALWVLLTELESSKQILAKIHPDLIEQDADGRTRVIDSWGMTIGVVFPCSDYRKSDLAGNTLAEDQSGDLTVRDQGEDGLGSCVNKQLYFVSSGPDALWGYRYQANPFNRDSEIWNACLDNLTSYEPFIVEDAR